MATRVVIAEDEAIIRLDLKETLQEEGYEVVGSTGRGDEAVSLVRELMPDLAILDIKMPGMDGLSAAREIAGERRAAVLILTAFSQRDLIEQARDAGALAYLVKPFERNELIPAVEVALGIAVVPIGDRRLGDQRAQTSIVCGVGQVRELLGADLQLLTQLPQPPGDLAQAPLDQRLGHEGDCMLDRLGGDATQSVRWATAFHRSSP